MLTVVPYASSEGSAISGIIIMTCIKWIPLGVCIRLLLPDCNVSQYHIFTSTSEPLYIIIMILLLRGMASARD